MELYVREGQNWTVKFMPLPAYVLQEPVSQSQGSYQRLRAYALA